MFGWLSRRCPLDTSEKAWVEWRMRWLIHQFGISQLKSVRVVEPTPEFLPTTWQGSEDEVRHLFPRVCEWLGANSSELELQVVPDAELNASGTYTLKDSRAIICIAMSQLDDLESLIATMAHEVAHHRLLGESRLTNEADHEWVTDLLPLYFGLGIFAANNVIQEGNYRAGNLSWWTLSKRGYLPARLFGYAFAIFAHLRGETRPEWMRYLRLDAVNTMRKGLRYLSSAERTLLDFPMAENRSLNVLKDHLLSANPTLRLSALWEIEQFRSDAAGLIPLVVEKLSDPDKAVRAEAPLVLMMIGDAAQESAKAIVPQLRDKDFHVRTNAAVAIRNLRPQCADILPELCTLLDEDDPGLVKAAALAVRVYGTDGSLPLRPVVLAYLRSRNRCDFETADALAAVLATIPELRMKIGDTFSDWDESQCDELTMDIIAAVAALNSTDAE